MATTHLALEFTDHRLRVAIASVTKTGATLTDVFVLEHPDARAEGQPDPAAAALRQALKARKVHPQRVLLILPKSQVTTRRVTLPSTQDEEIARMARFEAERHIPFHPERHIVDHHLVGREELQGAHVFLAAADQPVVAQALALAEAADLIVDQITVSSAASHTALLLAEGAAVAEHVIAYVDIGAESTDVSIVRHGDLLFTRSVSGGVKAMLAAAAEGGTPAPEESLPEMRMDLDHPDAGRAAALSQFVQRLAGELRRTYEFARREYSCPALEEVLVTGAGSLVDRLPETLGQQAGLPGRRIDLLRLAERASSELAQERTLAPCVACAGALARPVPAGAISINLTPPELKRRRQALAMRQMAVVTGVLALAVVALTLIYLRLSLRALRESSDEYLAQLHRLSPFIGEMEDKRTQIEIIQTHVDEENSALAILNYLSGLGYLPPRGYTQSDPAVLASLREFKYDRERGTLELSGYVRDFTQIAQLRSDLTSTGFFSNISVSNNQGISLSQRPGQVVTSFTFRCDLVRPDEEAPEAADDSRRPTRGDRFLGGGR